MKNFRYSVQLPSMYHVIKTFAFKKLFEDQYMWVWVKISTFRKKKLILKSKKYIRNITRKWTKYRRFGTSRIYSEHGIPVKEKVKNVAIF